MKSGVTRQPLRNARKQTTIAKRITAEKTIVSKSAMSQKPRPPPMRTRFSFCAAARGTKAATAPVVTFVVTVGWAGGGAGVEMTAAFFTTGFSLDVFFATGLTAGSCTTGVGADGSTAAGLTSGIAASCTTGFGVGGGSAATAGLGSGFAATSTTTGWG